MAIKVKEMKDDAIIDIQVNKAYYQMVKALAFYLFQQMNAEENPDYAKSIAGKSYAELDDLQRSFHTVTLLITEIERKSIENESYQEKEILQPGDEGYVEPTM